MGVMSTHKNSEKTNGIGSRNDFYSKIVLLYQRGNKNVLKVKYERYF